MANTVSCNVVTVYLTPNKPLRAAVAVMDTIVCTAQLLDIDNNPVNLSGCEVLITATDREKTKLYTAEIIEETQGRIRAVVQPDIPGQFKLTAKVGVTLAADEYTFFLGSFSVAADETGDPADTIHSLTDDLLAAKEAADMIGNDTLGYSQAAYESMTAALVAAKNAEHSESAALQAAQSATLSEQAAATSAQDAAHAENTALQHSLDAQGSAQSASLSAQAAEASAGNAATSETNAQASATAAETSAAGAAASATSAALSAQNAAVSETNARTSEQNAAASESAALTAQEQSQTIYDNIQAAVDQAATTAGEVAAQAAVESVAQSVQAAINELFKDAQPGQVLVKTGTGYAWDYPANAPIDGGAWIVGEEETNSQEQEE